MASAGPEPLSSSKDRPGEAQFSRAHRQGQRDHQQTAYFRHGQTCKLIGCWAFFSDSRSRMLANQACAIIERVMCRYQLCQKRTSYSSSPVSPLASSMHCSTVYRVEATRTSISSEVLGGA